MMAHPNVAVILLDIRSSENVGSIFRTADAAGVSKLYLTGYTPAPLDRFKRKNTKLAKAALGAEEFITWEAAPDVAELITNLKKDGWFVAAVEQHAQSVSYDSFSPPEKTAYILGNEVEGVPEAVLRQCDAIVEIPMAGKKESLNVSVAAGIILFNTRRA
jgi:tRNA G18 (ribose-2'-O)-methylase SpoU